MLRQAQSKYRQAVTKLNQDIQRRNQAVQSAVNKYNLEVRAHNERVKRNRQRIANELQKLSRTPVVRRYTVLHRSTITLDQAYRQLDQQTQLDESDPRYRLQVDLPHQENANNLALTNLLLTGKPEAGTESAESQLQETVITTELSSISRDLHDRWHGALFALNPRNPDAARHFCTSAREIFTRILHTRAPDDAVHGTLQNPVLDARGSPTRRTRIKYLLHQNGISDEHLEDFVEKDIDNVIDLFDVFNAATHGEAGRFDIHALHAVKQRVEHAIIFVARIAG